jgi:putative flippase GtrA
LKFPNSQVLRFILVGVLNTAFGYSCFVLFLYFGAHYALAMFLATVVGVLFNFKTIGKLVFRRDENKRFIKFLAVYCIQYLLNISLIAAFTRAGLSAYVAGAISLVLVAAVSFVLNKKFVFLDSP